MSRLQRALAFLRVVDSHDHSVSITSLLLGGIGAAVVAAPSWPAVIGLVVAAGLYAHKRQLNRETSLKDPAIRDLAESVASAAQKLQALESAHRQDHDRLVQVENRTKPYR